MKQFKMWMFAAVLTACGTTTMLTSCAEVNDNPVTPSSDDNGEAWIFDKDKDTSIKPGDDFFMYCNGNWWKNTDLGTKDIVGFLNTEVANYQIKIATPISAEIKKFINLHALTPYANADADGTTLKAATDMLANAKTKEELWTAMGTLKKQGFQMPYHLISLSKGGKMRLVFLPIPEFENANSLLSPSDIGDDDFDDLLTFFRSPKLANAIEPICQKNGTRSFQQDKWPMLVKICEGLGVDPAEAYIINEDFKEAIEDLESLNIGTLQDLEAIQALDEKELAAELTKYIEDDKIIFDKTYREQIEEQTKRQFNSDNLIDCISTKYLYYYTSYVYFQKYVTPEMKNRGLLYVNELKQVFRERINANTWLSEESKANVLEKLEAMSCNVGYPDEWLQEGLPNMAETKSLYEDVLEIRRSSAALTMKLLGMDVQKGSFHSLIAYFAPLFVVNAFYAPNFNSINILPIWLMKPLYDPAASDAYNYANISVFGHEITHGFDTFGANWNKIGDEGSIWASSADETEFNRRAKLLSDYFSSIEVMPGVYTNGEKTLKEDIADLGGIEIAFAAFTKHMKSIGITGEQLREQQRHFFYGYAHLWQSKYNENHIQNTLDADDHSLNKLRVNNILANVDAWYDLFDVKPGDKLYISPEKRIHIW